MARRRLRAADGDGAGRPAGQAAAGRAVPPGARAPVVPLRAGRPRGRHLRDRARLHRHPAAGAARRGHRRGPLAEVTLADSRDDGRGAST
ncbi:hypothetical protein NOCARDAX2BIS_100005 [Nocardioides sp. AX2bis]|nr:hypothetical protein NOCARDAX2BIS_100005 [Nocardioides sp. AX2bis]